MTTKEFKEKISSSKNVQWFTSVEISLNYHQINFSQTLKGITSIYEFFDQQSKGWADISDSDFQNSKKHFEDRKNSLINFLRYTEQDENTLNNHWPALKSQLQSSDPAVLIYDCPETEFLTKLKNDYPEAFHSAYNFISNRIQQSQLNDKNSFIGSMLAYEFTLKESSNIFQRKKGEETSLNKMKSDFRKYISASETQLVEHLANANKKYSEYSTAIDEIKKDKESLFDGWYSKSQDDFRQFDDASKSKIKDLEKTYEEKLRLEKPAKYWSDRAVQLKKEANNSLKLLLVLVLLGVGCLYFLLWKTPEGMLKSFFDNDKSIALRWSIIFIAFISLLFLGIRYVSKVMFSSFHLARDAEERQQLTHVYLALIKDAKIDEKERHLIMQSIFSRADTGLLKEDSSPTMPSGIDKLMSR